MKTAFLFPGQGAQFVGMGREFYEHHPQAKQLYQRANEVLGFDLTRICFEGPDAELNKTNICQPAILVTSLAALEVNSSENALRAGVYQFGVTPNSELRTPNSFDAAAGLSLGEYTALVVAGALSFEDAVRIVEKRGIFMQEACDQQPSGMASIIALVPEKVREICDSIDGVVNIANLNCPGQIVISGAQVALEEACVKAKQAGAKRVIPLKVAGAFHSPLMQSAEEKLRDQLGRIDIKTPTQPVVSNVTADYVRTPEEIRNCLPRQMVSPVLWQDSMKRLIQDGVKTFYEIGPGNVLTGLMQRIDKTVQCHKV